MNVETISNSTEQSADQRHPNSSFGKHDVACLVSNGVRSMIVSLGSHVPPIFGNPNSNQRASVLVDDFDLPLWNHHRFVWTEQYKSCKNDNC
jgi:hypothetical protein